MLDQAPPEQPVRDSAPPSLESRIANIFSPQPQVKPAPRQEAPKETQEVDAAPDTGDVEVPEAPDAEAPSEDAFEYEYEGEKFLLPKKLEKAVMQERDYTQKNQTLADQRRAVELKEQQFQLRELQQTFHNDVSNEIRQIQMIDAVLEQPVNWASMTTDDAFRHKIQLDDLEKQKAKLKEAINSKYQAWQQQSQQQTQELRTKALELVKKQIPAWDADLPKVREFAVKEGYSDNEINSIFEPRHAITLWKAMQYDALQAKAKPVVQQAKTAKTTSASPMPQQTKDYLNYRKAISKHRPGSPEHQRLVKERIAQKFSR